MSAVPATSTRSKGSASKTEALRVLSTRRLRIHSDRSWCPRVERRRQRERTQAEQARAARRITLVEYVRQYLAWAELNHRGYAIEAGRVQVMCVIFGEQKLDHITTVDLERFLDGLLATRAPATRNRYRTTLHAIVQPGDPARATGE